MTNTYIGTDGHKVHVERRSANGRVKIVELPHRRDIVNHSRKRFSWGNGCAQAAQLALAVLCFEAGVRAALKLHECFMWEVVARFPEDFRMSGEEVRAWVNGQRER